MIEFHFKSEFDIVVCKILSQCIKEYIAHKLPNTEVAGFNEQRKRNLQKEITLL